MLCLRIMFVQAFVYENGLCAYVYVPGVAYAPLGTAITAWGQQEGYPLRLYPQELKNPPKRVRSRVGRWALCC